MIDVNGLRETLRRHAATVVDAPEERLLAVHGRIRGVRRRRTALAAITATGVVLAGIVLALPLGRWQPPDDRVLAGVTAPASITVDGYRYGFDRGVQSDGRQELVLRLPASDQPRLISWTASAGATLRLTGPPATNEGLAIPSQFTDYELLWPGEDYRAVLHDDQGRPMALAVYALGTERPPGVTDRGLTFRRVVDGETLLGAAFDEAGDGEASIMVKLTDRPLRLSVLCQSPLPQGVFVASVEGVEVSAGPCRSGPDFDPGRSGVDLALAHIRVGDRVARPGDVVELRVVLNRDFTDPRPVSVPGTRLGIAGYEAVLDLVDLGGGLRAESSLSTGGHLWRLAGRAVADPGSSSVSLAIPAGETPVQVDLVVPASNPRVDLEILLDGQASGSITPAAGETRQIPLLGLRPGEAHVVTVRWKSGEAEKDLRLGLITYLRQAP